MFRANLFLLVIQMLRQAQYDNANTNSSYLILFCNGLLLSAGENLTHLI